MIVVGKRFPGERHYVCEFIRPKTYMVAQVANRLSGKGDYVAACMHWVSTTIRYPPGLPTYSDWHRTEAFVASRFLGRVVPLVSRDSYDFWQFPEETIAIGMGDCEDLSILLCSLLRTRIPETDVFVTIGTYAGYGHAWVTYKGVVLDPTPLDGTMPQTPEAPPYHPAIRFNDMVAFEDRR